MDETFTLPEPGEWNVERNYCASEILSTLEELDPDIAFIQEIDINCKRSGDRNHFKEIASKLGWKGGFVCEFIELESELRTEMDQGGGVHGNAIFTKHDISFRVLDHEHHPLDWEKMGETLCEPRKGRRYTLVAEVVIPKEPPILCYCVHLEVFCGIIGRIIQFSEILEDSVKHIKTHPYQLIFGDLNTMGHSIARFSRLYCNDRYRFLSLGLTESEWWDNNLFDWHINDGDINLKLQSGGFKVLESLFKRSFTFKVLRASRNPGFYDPWSPTKDITFHNKNYLGLYSAKLDWTLICRFNVINRWIGNNDYSSSDHKYMMVELEFDKLSDLSLRNYWEIKRNFWKKESNLVDDKKGKISLEEVNNEVKNNEMSNRLKIIGIGITIVVITFKLFHK